MAQIRAKQLYFSTEGQLIVGSTGSKGKYLNPGLTGQVLSVTANGLAWGSPNSIRNENDSFSVTATSDAIEFKTSGEESSTILKLVQSETGVTLTVDAENSNALDLILSPAAGGNVVIGGEGSSTIEAEADEDLSIKGGEGAGNLFLSAGVNGKVYYGTDASNPLNEVATIGTVRSDWVSSFNRLRYQGNAEITIPANAITNSIEVYANGVLVDRQAYTITNNTVSFDEEELGFFLDIDDTIEVIFVGIA